jgi:O-antigen ligase
MISDYICLTHPHQIYIEFLAEHGLIGTTILLTIFFLLLFRNLKKILINRNYISVGCFCYLIVVFTPILPGGSFFTDYNISLFFINLSLMHATSKEMNIFKITQNNV